MQEYANNINIMMIEDGTMMRQKGMLLKSTFNCKKLRSQLFQLCKEKDVFRVRSIYQSYLDNCFTNEDEEAREKMKEYFENFLDSFLTDEEKELDQLTLINTQRNKEHVEIDDKAKTGIEDGNCSCCNSSAPLKIRKQVQINLEPEINLIELRTRKNKK